MNLARGRIVRRSELSSEPEAVFTDAHDGSATRIGMACGRVLKRVELEAQARASRVIAEARDRAEAAAAASDRVLAELQLVAGAEARAVALAELAALATRLARHEGELMQDQLGRTTLLARLLAERLIGAELALDENRIVDIAREVVQELRGVRRVVIEAHPEDARVLRRRLSSLASDSEDCGVLDDPSLDRGDLRLRTEVGVVETRIAGRLELLAEKLVEGLQS